MTQPIVNFSPEFKDFSSGTLFCIKSSTKLADCSKVVLIIPPFAEEMNKSRKMMSLLLQKATSSDTDGYLFDLYGTGDSYGDFVEATWKKWKDNIASMLGIIADNNAIENISVVAIRTGALLLNDLLSSDADFKHAEKINSIHYWNPVFNASQFISQFMRLRLAASMIRNDGVKVSVKDLRHQLQVESTLEVAGYMLNNELIDGMEKAKITLPTSFDTVPLHFYELSSLSHVSPGLQKKMREVRENDTKCFTHVVKGPQFWSTQEISISEPLLDLTEARLFSQ